MRDFRFRKLASVFVTGLFLFQLLAHGVVAQTAPVSDSDLSVAPANDAFERTWARTDQPVISAQVSRTWMWGIEPFTNAIMEQYAESPDGQRTVQYFDKSRMEITSPAADQNSIWYVSNGLLATELITGQMQLGHNTFEQHEPAQVNVAGDADDPNGPTYATFAAVLDTEPAAPGSIITRRIDRNGIVTDDPALSTHAVTTSVLDTETNHVTAGPFWAFMTSEGTVWENGTYTIAPLFETPVFATGRPITEAYWAEVVVGGTAQDVLIQCFERRCLTFAPENDSGWQVEAGNVGQHYYAWRHTPPTNDTSPPTFSSVPDDLEIVKDPDAASGIVRWSDPTAHDSVDGVVLVSCTPASGSAFGLGVTLVTCAATDSAGNTSNVSFTVTVHDPFTFEIDAGIDPNHVQAFRDGLAIAADYLDSHLSGRVRGPIIVRITMQDICGSQAVAWDGHICFYMGHPNWQTTTYDDKSQIAAHEYVHNWQYEIGCIDNPTWIVEGTAQWVSYLMMASVAKWDIAREHQNLISYLHTLDQTMPALPNIRHDTPGAPYGMWWMAMSVLTETTGASSIMANCQGIAAGESVEDAFQHAFGQPLSEFYAAFAQYRAGLGI